MPDFSFNFSVRLCRASPFQIGFHCFLAITLSWLAIGRHLSLSLSLSLSLPFPLYHAPDSEIPFFFFTFYFFWQSNSSRLGRERVKEKQQIKVLILFLALSRALSRTPESSHMPSKMTELASAISDCKLFCLARSCCWQCPKPLVIFAGGKSSWRAAGVQPHNIKPSNRAYNICRYWQICSTLAPARQRFVVERETHTQGRLSHNLASCHKVKNWHTTLERDKGNCRSEAFI